ncbi:MAG: hypothetical protein IT316_07425 [Anaerolineales bacterium]|nr:hypothetical protein [Anaerolineales bacterium]
MSIVHKFPLSFRTLSRLMLALIVLTVSLALMPQATQAAPQAESAPKPVLRAWLSGSQLHIEGSQMPRNHMFKVRVQRAPAQGWTKLSVVKADSKGKVTADIRLQNKLAQITSLKVCLKDMSTNRSYCTSARR